MGTVSLTAQAVSVLYLPMGNFGARRSDAPLSSGERARAVHFIRAKGFVR